MCKERGTHYDHLVAHRMPRLERAPTSPQPRSRRKTMLTLKKTLALSALLASTLLAVHAPARAAELDEWQLMISHKMMDKDKNGMVSRKEFLDMMGKAYDMKAKEMKADAKGMNEAELKAFLKSLYIN
jgi:hypothetical protein